MFSQKVIKAVLFTIDNHEKYISSVGYQNKKIQTQDKWNHLNLMHIQSFLGTNHCLPLSNMDKSYIWLEETNECIDEFSIGYMINPSLGIKKAFKEKFNKCMKTTFSTSTMT